MNETVPLVTHPLHRLKIMYTTLACVKWMYYASKEMLHYEWQSLARILNYRYSFRVIMNRVLVTRTCKWSKMDRLPFLWRSRAPWKWRIWNRITSGSWHILPSSLPEIHLYHYYMLCRIFGRANLCHKRINRFQTLESELIINTVLVRI